MAKIVLEKVYSNRDSTRLGILLEKASQKMLKNSEELTKRKGKIDQDLTNLRISLRGAPVRAGKKR
ncbi:hypothetical protein [Gluconobacter kondonii]|uniref:hypothetical protein n=1 Tax=Gluconobacter kondonii TaxID=941463 RepID=UPI001B8B23B8|nr:hypothetical protein [Gluconobacter kondonii]MBS1057530.1 hypothetical protein [Gluconobacter kondonii]